MKYIAYALSQGLRKEGNPASLESLKLDKCKLKTSLIEEIGMSVVSFYFINLSFKSFKKKSRILF